MAHVGVIEELEAAASHRPHRRLQRRQYRRRPLRDNPNVCELKTAVWKLKTESMLNISLAHCRFGLSRGDTMQKVLDDHLCAETFDELKIPLVIVATDLNTGELVPMGFRRPSQGSRSSCSIPFVFVLANISDATSSTAAPSTLSQSRLPATWERTHHRRRPLRAARPHPSHQPLQIATRSAEIAFMWQNEVCTKHADIIIRPKTCGIGAFNDKKSTNLYRGKTGCKNDISTKSKEKSQPLAANRIRHDNVFVCLEAYTPSIYHQTKVARRCW